MFLLKLFVFVFSHFYFVHNTNPYKLKIGVISDGNADSRVNDPKFWSLSDDYPSSVTIQPVVANVQWWDALQVTRTVCSLFSEGVDGLLSFPPPNLSPVLSSYANTYGLPLITKSSPRNPKVTNALNYELKMIPKSEKTVYDLLEFYKWKSFAFFYDSDDGPQLLQRILDTSLPVEVEAVWRVTNAEQAARYLQLLETNSEYQLKKETQNVLFATDNDLLDETLRSMPITFGKMKFHFISAYPVVRLRKWYFPVWNLVTRMSMVDSNKTAYKTLEEQWNKLPRLYGRLSDRSTNPVPEDAILIHDAVRLLSKSYSSGTIPAQSPFGRNEEGNYNPAIQTHCSQNPEKTPISPSTKGSSASTHLKQNVLENCITGKLKFDESGERSDFSLQIFETNSSATKKMGDWSDYEGLKISNGKISSNILGDDPSNNKDQESKITKTLIITSILTTPFLMQKQSPTLQGNDRFDGFIKDLMDLVSNHLQMNYEIRLVKDGRYGTYNGTHWTGMIGEVINGQADVAVAPLTISRSREEVVDFTKPFMSVGLNILMKKPAILDGKVSTALAPFGFLYAFTYDTWLVFLIFYAFFAVGFFVVSRFTGAPDRIRSVDTKGSDQLSLCSSFWFAAGSLFMQNTGIYPRSVSHRLLSIVWWIFILVTVITYIGSLSSMLIKERTKIHGAVDSYLTSFQMLKSFIETGSPAIGLIRSGSTHEFFRNSEVGIYHEYGKYLEQNTAVITHSYAEGVERVRNSNGSYAFIIESTSSEFISNHPPCDTVATAGYLDNRAYGMAVKKDTGSDIKNKLDNALLDLLEFGALRQIYEKWWHRETECSNPTLNILPGLYDNSLTIAEVSGVFYILVFGAVAASVAALTEYFLRSKRLPVDK